MGFRTFLIRLLAEKDTVYLGKGTYHWVNYQEKLVIRSSQRIVALDRHRTDGIKEAWYSEDAQLKNTRPWERGWDEWQKWIQHHDTTFFLDTLESELEKSKIMPRVDDMLYIREIQKLLKK